MPNHSTSPIRLVVVMLAAITSSAACGARADVPPPAFDRTAARIDEALAFRAYLQQPWTAIAGTLASERAAAIQPTVAALYEATGMRPLWADPAAPSPRALALLAILTSAERDGLEPEDYQPELLAEFVHGLYAGGTPPDERRFAADRSLTEALVLYAADLSRGRVDPERAAWHLRRDTVPLEHTLADVLLRDDMTLLRSALAPPFREYEALARERARYAALAATGGWEPVPEGEKLDLGTRASALRIAALERRLRNEGDLTDFAGADAAMQVVAVADGQMQAEAVYDERLAAAVRHFQRRHGIGSDGVVGPKTMRELNVSADARVRQIELNLERWRFMPRDIEPRHLRVNIPAFELALYDGADGPVASMAVIVGRRSWPTPVFSDRVEFIVLNPYWNVPRSIARDELMPKVRADASFLRRERYVLTDASGTPVELDPHELERVSHRTHFLRQLPGADNALGKIKFMFPNKWDVYLHDTPNRSLFGRAERAFSHGCIRVERPFDLAEYLVRDDSQWSMQRVEKMFRKGPDKWLRLENSVPIYIVYFTASVTADGKAIFHPDIYDRDSELEAAIQRASGRIGTALVSTESAQPATP